MTGQQGFRRVVMYGGEWKFRWAVRLALLIAIAACGFIPYANVVGGNCRVLPFDERGIRAQVDGEITDVYVKEGSYVSVGDPIATMMARDEVAAVAQYDAALDVAKSNLLLLENGTRPEEIAIAEQKVEQWQTQLTFAKMTYDRELKLSVANAGATKKVEDAQLNKEVAEKELTAAKENLAKLRSGSREEEIDAAKAEVRRLTAELAYHRQAVELTSIKSPIAGIVVTSNVRERLFQNAKQGDLIAVVHDASSLRVEVMADERAAPCVRVGMTVQIRFNGTDGRTITGRVESIAPLAVDDGQFGLDRVRSDDETRAEEIIHKEGNHHVSVYVELDEHDESLIPGMTGYAKVVIGPDYLYNAIWRPIKRFFLVDVWSWLP